MKIAVIGTGYVGLVTGTCLAETGHRVTCVDLDARKIATLRAGGIPIYEPGLEELVKRNVRDGRLDFTTSTADAVRDVDVAFIAVGTPPGETGEADLSYVLAAAEQIGRSIGRYTVIVNKSTVPVGSADRVSEVVARVAQAPFDVVSNPEFLKEGAAIDDFMRPDRIVVGVASDQARAVMTELYAPFVRTEQPILFMDRRSSELTKYAANAMLATRISFMNDVANLCERVGADVDHVRRGMGSDKRIGYPFLFPGVGFGGSCFPKDVRALMTMARGVGLDFDLLRSVERVNERQKRTLLEKAQKRFGSLQGLTFAVWGLAFKPKTDDMREAPSITIIEGLLGNGARVRAHDPVAHEVAASIFGGRIELAPDPYAAAAGADAIVLVTEWNEFRQPDFERLKQTMKQPVLFDGRNVWDPVKVRALGFSYQGIGRAAREDPGPAWRETLLGARTRRPAGALGAEQECRHLVDHPVDAAPHVELLQDGEARGGVRDQRRRHRVGQPPRDTHAGRGLCQVARTAVGLAEPRQLEHAALQRGDPGGERRRAAGRVMVLQHLDPELPVRTPGGEELLDQAHPGHAAQEDVVAAVRKALVGLDDSGTGHPEERSAVLGGFGGIAQGGHRQEPVAFEGGLGHGPVARLEDVEGGRRAREHHHLGQRKDLEGAGRPAEECTEALRGGISGAIAHSAETDSMRIP